MALCAGTCIISPLIPASERHPFEAKTIAVVEDEFEGRTHRGNDFLATHEGGRRNGVLTAIEDFMKESSGDDYYSGWFDGKTAWAFCNADFGPSEMGCPLKGYFGFGKFQRGY